MGGGMGMGGGLGFGPRPRAPDDRAVRKERTRGKMGSSGEFNDVQSFKGLPTEGEAKTVLRTMVQSATQEAEDALGQEEIPRKRREAVQKYFEGVQPK
jgi:hypothetical protein